MKEQLKHVRLTFVIFDPPAAASDSSIRRVVYYRLAASATEGSKSQARNQIFLLEWSHPSFPFSLPFLPSPFSSFPTAPPFPPSPPSPPAFPSNLPSISLISLPLPLKST